MRVNSINTSPNFSSNVKFIYEHTSGLKLFESKPFKTLVNKIANNGENSTVVLMPTVGHHFPMYEQWIVNRNNGHYIGNKAPIKQDYVWNPSAKNPEDKFKKADYSFQAINAFGTDNLDIYVAKEIDGKPHIGASTIGQDQNIDFAEYRYQCAESHSPDNPVPEWMDKRLYKYLAPKQDSRVMLMYDVKYHDRKNVNDLYKNEDFINLVEWLDKDFMNKEKDGQLIIYPMDKFNDGTNYVGFYMTKPYTTSNNQEYMRQSGNTICWKDSNYNLLERLKDRVSSELKHFGEIFPNVLK